jgi:hypothetical protein
MRYFTNIQARYVWRILTSDSHNRDVLTDPKELLLVGSDGEFVKPEPLNQNHLGQPFFTDRDLAYQKLDHWMMTHESDANFVLIEVNGRENSRGRPGSFQVAERNDHPFRGA